MIEAPLALAFTAGLVATINPCGFAMLPAYLSFFLGLDDEGAVSGPATMARALAIGGVVTLGFLVVFGAAGLALTFGARAIIDVLPWAAIVIGVLVGLLGLAMMGGYRPSTDLPGIGQGKQRRSYSGVFVFGVSYAVASLSCTLPIFLTVVTGGITGTDPLGAAATVLAYGTGMAVVLLAVTVLVALGRQTVVRWLTRASQHIERVAGGVLLLAGTYIVWFWVSNLGSDIGDVSGPVRFVEGLSSDLTQIVGDHPVWSAAVAAATVAAALAYVGWTRWTRQD